jgi:hypothetical protein
VRGDCVVREVRILVFVGVKVDVVGLAKFTEFV